MVTKNALSTPLL